MCRLQTSIVSLLFSLPLLLLSQQSARITGTIQNVQADQLEVEYPSHFLSQIPEVQSSKLSSKGQFSIDLPISNPAKVGVYAGEVELEIYLEPGYELSLFIDAKEGPQSLTFSGDGASENQCFQAYLNKFFGDEDAEQGFFLHLQHDLPNDFLAYGEEYLDNRASFFEAFQEEHSLSENFLRFSEEEYSYSFAELLFQYSDRYQERSREEGLPRLEASFFTFLDEVSFQNDDAINREVYRNAASAYLRHKFGALMAERMGSYDYDMRGGNKDRLALADMLFQGKTRDMLIGSILADAISQGAMEEVEEELKRFIEDKESSLPGPVAQLKELMKNPAPSRSPEWEPED